MPVVGGGIREPAELVQHVAAVGGCGGLTLHPAGLVGEVVGGRVVGQDVQVEPAGAVQGDQRGEPVPAGDQDLAARRPRQQRPHLLGPGGVVQHDQHPPPAQQRPVHPGDLVLLRREVRGGHPEGAYEPLQHLRRRHRRPRAVAVQVDVQLPVREPVRQPVGGPDSQRGLADATAADQHPDAAGPPPAASPPSWSSCSVRPVKSATSAGSCRGDNQADRGVGGRRLRPSGGGSTSAASCPFASSASSHASASSTVGGLTPFSMLPR
jgi:hypothetical protein